MTQRKNSACAATRECQSPESAWPENSIEPYDLRTTLEAYEVQDLDCQKLGLFLPEIVSSESTQEEWDLVSPDIA